MQGIAAMTGYNPESSVDENKAAMTECLENVVSGSVTYAVRDTSYNGNTIHSGDIIGLINGSIRNVGTNVSECTLGIIKTILNEHEDRGFVSVYWGEGASEESASAIVSSLEEEYPDIEFMVRKGGQPLYYYFISAE